MGFKYENPYYLNILINHINGNCKLRTVLEPNVPEFIDAKFRSNFFRSSQDLTKYEKDTKESENTHIIYMLKLCNKHNIMPFWKLKFDREYNNHRPPEIIYDGKKFKGIKEIEPETTCSNPIIFTQKRKWYSIEFDNFQGEKNIEEAQLAIQEFINQGYVVTTLSAVLNPTSSQSDHYYTRTENDGSFFAHNGWIATEEKFDFPKEPKKIKKEFKLLEELTKNLEENS